MKIQYYSYRNRKEEEEKAGRRDGKEEEEEKAGRRGGKVGEEGDRRIGK